MNGTLQKTVDGLQSAADQLKEALDAGSCVEFIVLIPLITRAVELQRDVRALLDAREFDGKDDIQ